MPVDLFGGVADAMPPLDLGDALTPQAPPPSAPSARARAREYAPLLALLPIIARTGGRVGIASLLHGFQQARAQHQQTERQARADQQTQDYRQQQLQLQANQQQQTATRQREADRRALLEDVQRAVGRVDSPEAVRALLPFYTGRAQALGMPVHEIEGFVLEQATPTVLQRRAATAALDQARKLYGERAPELSYQLEGEAQPVTYAELQRRAGAVPATRPTVVTYADLFPEARGLAIASHAVPTLEGGAVNLDAATRVLQRMGVIGRRGSGRTSDSSDRRERVSVLDEESAFLLRSAARGQSPADAAQRWAKLARQYDALGIPFEPRRDSIRVRVERERRSGSGTDVDALLDDALGGVDVAAPASPVVPTKPPAAPAQVTPGRVYRFQNGRLVPK